MSHKRPINTTFSLDNFRGQVGNKTRTQNCNDHENRNPVNHCHFDR